LAPAPWCFVRKGKFNDDKLHKGRKGKFNDGLYTR